MTVLHRRTNDRRHAFSIIELLMVVALISIVTAWGLPRLDFNRYRADAAGRLARTLLQTAQRNAITRQSDVIVSFDLATNRLRLVQDYNNNDTLNATDRVEFRALPEGAKFATPNWVGVGGTTPSAPISGSAIRTVSSMPSIIFRRDGSSSSDAELYVTMRDRVKTEYRAVTIVASTGKTNMFKWNGSAWIAVTQ